jgi:hypothetical protein
MIGLIINLESFKICVYDKKTKEPISDAQVWTSLTFTFTDNNGCAYVKMKENDSLIVYRIGYKMVVLKEKNVDKIYLENEGISLKTINVISKSIKIKEVKDIKNDVENSISGSILNKPIVSGFSRDKYNIIVDGAFLNDQSDYLDHPIVIDYDLVDKMFIASSKNNAIFGLNSISGGIDLKLFDIQENNSFNSKFQYYSENDRLSIIFKNNKNYNKFSYKFGFKGSISSDFKNPRIENTSDSSIWTIASLKFKNFSFGNYLSYINYGIPRVDSRAKNLFINPRISYRNLIFDFQNSIQREYADNNLETELNLKTLQTIYNSNNFYLNLTYNNFSSFGEEEVNYSRYLLSLIYSNEIKNILNYSFSIIPNYSDFNKKLKVGLTFLFSKDLKNFSFLFSQSILYPSLQQLTFTGIHESANRYEIANENLKDEISFNFSLDYKHSFNFITFSINPSFDYVKNFILLKDLDTIISDLSAYTWENHDVYFINLNSEISLIISKDIILNSSFIYSEPSVNILFYTKPQMKTTLSIRNLNFINKIIFDESITSIFSISLNYSLKLIKLQFSIENLFNENFIEPTNPFKTSIPYRNYSIKISI